jgi:hypothetical protein
MTWIRRGWSWLADRPRQTRGVGILRAVIGAVLLLRVYTEVPLAAYLWGPHGLGWGSTRRVLGPTLGGAVDHVFASEVGTLGVLLAMTVGALGLLIGWHTRAAAALSLAAVCLLDGRLPEVADRGDTLIRLLLLFLVFTLPKTARTVPGSLSVWLHNLAVLAICFQGAVLYATAGLLKAWADPWQQGTAVYAVSQVQSLAHPAFRDVFKEPLATTAASFFTILLEVWFPIAVLTPMRVTWVVLGVVFHLLIAGFLGLITFSAIMIGLDLVYISDAEYSRLGAAVRRAGKGVAWSLGTARDRPK